MSARPGPSPSTAAGAWAPVLALLLALSGGAAEAGGPSPLLDPRALGRRLTSLDPHAIAHGYARRAPFRAGLDEWVRELPTLSLWDSDLERRWTYADLIVFDPTYLRRRRFWQFEQTDTTPLVVRLQRWQRRLAIRVGASERSAGGRHHFEGLGDLEQDEDYGRTFAAANGQLRGDVTLVFGNVGSTATVEDVQEGRASILELNPFREIGAQFDLAIFEDTTRVVGGVMILRLRAAYLGLVDRVAGGADAGVAAESQLGCGVGIKW